MLSRENPIIEHEAILNGKEIVIRFTIRFDAGELEFFLVDWATWEGETKSEWEPISEWEEESFLNRLSDKERKSFSKAAQEAIEEEEKEIELDRFM
tara:strand:- start:1604 stop:1891 length:288 start_codon:yes stop_codon:yes gene_type:complete